MSDSDILAAALRYAAAGVHVFPARIGIRGDGKKEVFPVAAWKEASTTDPDVITSWWGPAGTRRDSALCIDCGKSGIVMIDQDVSDGKQGPLEWEKLSPPPTWRVRSGSGGAHDYFRANPSRPVSVDNDGAVADGVDVRGEGGFAFAPPSIDPRGGRWEWIDGEPDWDALPPVPDVVLDRMEARAAGRRPKPCQQPALAPSRIEPEATPAGTTSILFASPSELDDRDFGPDGGYKTRAAALALLSEQHRRFAALTEQGSARSHILSQEFAVLAGHGVGVFWEYEWAFEQLMSAARDNGMCDVHGERYVADQARRGLEFGMREPWHEQPAPAEALAAAVTATPGDAVDALLAELLTPEQVTERKPPRYLIHGLLQFDSESWIIGPPGSKKSFVVLDQAARVAAGMPWQGRRTNPADVVMIVAEGAGGVGKRIKAWTLRHGPMPAGIHILPRPVQAGTPEKWAVLVAACGRLAASARERGRGMLVVVDTQARVTVGLKENDATDMGVFIDAVSAIRQATGGCVLVVHHTGRAGGDARGSSAVDGAQTTELKIIPGKGRLAARLSVEKQKDIEELDPIDLAFEVVDVGQDEDGERVSSLVMAEPGSAAFRAAYEGAETSHEDIEAIEEGKAHRLTARVVVDHWIREKTWSKPTQWAVQILCDIGRERGLTKSEVKAMVEQKVGQEVKRTTWNDTWTLITDSGREWAGIVIPASGERWTVDPVAVEGVAKRDKEG